MNNLQPGASTHLILTVVAQIIASYKQCYHLPVFVEIYVLIGLHPLHQVDSLLRYVPVW